jgi:hypothetical protein
MQSIGFPFPPKANYSGSYNIEFWLANLDIATSCSFGRLEQNTTDRPSPEEWLTCHTYHSTEEPKQGQLGDFSVKINHKTWELTLKQSFNCDDAANGT